MSGYLTAHVSFVIMINLNYRNAMKSLSATAQVSPNIAFIK